MADRLGVWAIGALGVDSGRVGRLTRSADSVIAFGYDESWPGPAISIGLPIGEQTHGEKAARFFANLLPEGGARQRICQRLQISEDNDFGLLEAIGGECAGALSILPEGEVPSDEPPAYEALTEADRAALSDTERVVPLLVGGATTRLSLAGAHDKLPIFVDGKQLYLPLLHAPSTHILKLGHPTLKHVPENEALVTWFAAELGFEVPAIHLLAKPSMLLVERYDRRRGEAWVVHRLHQEDMCQATARPPSRKYEHEGGPSLAECVEVIRDHTRDPLAGVRRMLRWSLFNLMAGNSDAHGKNLSLLYDRPGPPRLAPFYDLVCTRAYPRLARELAMGIGGETDPGRIDRRHLTAMSETLDIGPRLLPSLAAELIDKAEPALDRAVDRFREARGDHPVLQMVPVAIRKRVRRLRQRLKS